VVGRITSGRTALAARGSPDDRAGAVIDFSRGAVLPLVVAVTAEDGSAQEYLVEVRRTEPDHNNALAELAVAGSRTSPAFSSRVFRYAVEVPYSTRQLVVTARAQSAYARMDLVPGPTTVSTAVPPLQARGDLARGGVTVEFPTAERIVLAVAVTAQDGATQQYVLDVRRAPPDSNADLGALTVSAGVLSPIFSPRVISYAVSLPASIDSVRITAAAASDVATVAVEGSTARPAATQVFTVAVAGGATETVNLIVTAEDSTQKLYRVRVSREATGPGGGTGDANTRLARLQLVGAQLNPNFDPLIVDYEARLASNVPSVTLIAVAESPTATVEVDGRVLERTGRVIALEPGAERMVVIDVTAERGNIATTVLWLSRERSGSGKDTNTRLARLQLMGAELSPSFDPRILEYQARFASSMDSVILSAVTESPVATITVDGRPLERMGREIFLEPGAAKTVLVDVRAESGTTARTLVRLSRDAAKDSNARLSRLQLAGAELEPNFDPRITEYQARMAANVPSVTLIATAESARATIEVDGQPLARTGRVIALDPGASRTVAVDVRAESGNVARTLVRLSRGGGTPPVEPPGGGDRISVTLDKVKVARRELASLSAGSASIGSEARITVRSYRTTRTLAQGTANLTVKMEGATPVISATWTTSAVKLDPNRLVEVEVAIPAAGSAWLFYTEAQWASSDVEVDVPFLLFARDLRVAWSALGRNVSVTGFITLPRGGPGREGPAGEAEGLQLNSRGEYGIEVTITDPSSGKVLGQDTVWTRPGLPRGRVLAFSRPMSLPEGATVKYTLTAAARSGRGWTATGTTQVWTTKLAYDGGFEPVVLQFAETLAPPR